MKRIIHSHGWTAELEWQQQQETATYVLQLDGSVSVHGSAAIHEIEPGLYSVLVEGRSHEVKIVPGAAGWNLDVDGRHFSCEVIDPRENSRPHRIAPGHGRVTLRAPMPGKVVRLLAVEGDCVAADQGVLVVEAMKMQNEIKSPAPGVVVSLPARPGDTVAANQPLAVVEVIPEDGE